MWTIDLPKQDCVGCGACENICPLGAISMLPDEEGFLYPHVDRELCTKCGTCHQHCPVMNGATDLFHDDEPLAVYAGWSLNHENRLSGSSGGIFGEVAEAVLAQRGYVAGAAYTSDHTVEHRVIHELSELPMLKKSKYLQSRIGHVFSEVRGLLARGETVFFVGTPCQCAGLIAFLGDKPNNLLLCDFVCHGVNSPAVHQRYINEVETFLGKHVQQINHRDKEEGWQNFQLSVSSEGEKYLLGGKRKNPFLRGFLTNLFLRPSCYNCPFKGSVHPVDLTLGDCWGYPHDEENGVSLMLVHTTAGQNLLTDLKEQICIHKYMLQQAILNNPSLLQSSTDRFHSRDIFFQNWIGGEPLNAVILEILGN